MSFNELRLAEPIVRAVIAQGYTTPTPIQARAIPEAVGGRDVLGCAQTGTGKTCAFALPILHRLSENKPIHGQPSGKGGRGRAPRALILCPTRELATQIFDSFKDYSKYLKLRHTVVFGGVSQGRQVRDLRDGIDVLVATPGRLLDLINQGHIDLSRIETLVLDEADRMLDMGFISDIRKVVAMLPDPHQTLFFSATVSREIRQLADSILDNPVCIETAPESTTADSIAQKVYTVNQENKPMLLGRILADESVKRALVFTRTKHGADKLSKILNREGINAEAIHGNKTQNARTRTMKRFKAGATHVLVATDVASRGIDVDDITHVINFDMPIDSETYVHRIGRTARAGASGIAISFCSQAEIGVLRDVERRTRNVLEVGEDQPDLTFVAPERSRRGPATHYTKRKPNFHERPVRSGGRSRPRRADAGNGGSRRPEKNGERKEYPNHGKPGQGVKSEAVSEFKPKAKPKPKAKSNAKPKSNPVASLTAKPKAKKAKTKEPFAAKAGAKARDGKTTGAKASGAGKARATSRSGGSAGHRKGPGAPKKSPSRS